DRRKEPVIRSILAEAVLDQPDELQKRGVGAVALRMDGDRIALGGAEHHQAHDRRAVDAAAALFDLDRHAFGQAADEGHEFGAGARVQAALVGDLDGFGNLVQGPTPSISDATEIYFWPASFAAITAARSSIVLRALSRRISIGRLTPAITSVRPASSRLIARFDGVPPNRSVSITTPRPSSTLRIASAISLRRISILSLGPMHTVAMARCGPTTCSIARTISSARRPWVTSTIPRSGKALSCAMQSSTLICCRRMRETRAGACPQAHLAGRSQDCGGSALAHNRTRAAFGPPASRHGPNGACRRCSRMQW